METARYTMIYASVTLLFHGIVIIESANHEYNEYAAISGCPPHHPYRCLDGECIPSGQVCDGFVDCPTGEDEHNCSSCSAEEFQCVYNYDHCIPMEWRCDGTANCHDRSDENGCPPPTCAPDQFQCGDRRCIPARWKCDGHADCYDGYDEADAFCAEAFTEAPTESTGTHAPGTENADCSGDHVSCTDGGCVPPTLVCDGYQDCVSGEDEAEELCSPTEYECQEGFVACGHNLGCITADRLCDGVNDCPDDSDEANCPVTDQPEGAARCMPGYFACGSGECVPTHMLCNSQENCEDGSDEDVSNCARHCYMEEHSAMLLLGDQYETVTDVTLDVCKQECLQNDACLSIDFIIEEEDATCYINFASHVTDPDLFFHYNSDYRYLYKKCPAM